jgi:glycosyltransferase involved in cell wall biosynthesis
MWVLVSLDSSTKRLWAEHDREIMQLAYLVNQYPAVSHSFVRREILAIEALGHSVSRFSIRAPQRDLPDARDRQEALKTATILSGNFAGLAAAAIQRLLRHPRRVLTAFRQTRSAPGRAGLVRRIAYVAEGIWLGRELERAGVQHLHAHFGTNPAAVARVAHLVSGISYSFTVHGPDEFDEPAHIDLPGKIADASFVVAISDYGRSQLCRWSKLADWHKIVVVRCGLDIDQFDQFAAENEDERDLDLCTIARLAPQKGLPILIEALGSLARAGRRPNLTIIGDGPLRDELEAQARNHGVADQVRFLGARDGATVTEVLTRSKIMVLPSFAEGLPVVIMEAYACGTPVATTAIAGIPELVDRSCGWLIPPGSVEALAAAITAGLDSSIAQRQQLSAVGQARVRDLHDVRKNAKQLVGHVEAALQ